MTKKTSSILREVALLFLVGIFIVGILSFLSMQYLTSRSVERETVAFADSVTDEVLQAVTEYPGYPFLFRYWHDHAGELEMEYDVDYEDGMKTKLQCQIWNQRNPEVPLDYVTVEEIEAMPEEDQRLYAEVIYSWTIRRLNQIKAASGSDYIFVILTDESFREQFFLMSAALPGDERGKEYKQVYTLGTTVEVSEEQQNSMTLARENQRHLTDAGDYVDYYTYLDRFGDHLAFIGITNNQTGLEKDKMRQTVRQTMPVVLFLAVLAALCLLLLYRAMIRPLRNVQESIRRYKNTKDSRKVIEQLSKIRSHNEIGELSQDVQEMAEEVDDYMAKIETFTAENERISTELNLASRIQMAMLPLIFPPFPDHEELDIYATMIPAKEVGGDFYDFFLVDEDHLGLVMADVSGKGVPAALFMTITKVLIKNELVGGKTPAEALTTINDRICQSNSEEMFVTVWAGVLDMNTGALTACNAGHEYPVMKRPGGHFELIRDKHGFVIGGMPGMKYTDYTLQMDPGTKLFVYTDGVPEAETARHEQFGMDRAIMSLRRYEDLTSMEIITGLSTEIHDYVGEHPQFDDLTMLCLHYKGKDTGR